MNPKNFLNLGCSLEATDFLLGIALCGLFGPGCFSDLHWNSWDALKGLLATLPPLALFFGAVKAQWKPLRGIQEFLEVEMRPLFRGWTAFHILIVSLLAGLSEEFLFRGAVQGILGRVMGGLPALVLASVIFGCFHPLTWGYVLMAALIGFYLGLCWILTGNLLVPIITHAVYDFVALIWFVKTDRCNGG